MKILIIFSKELNNNFSLIISFKYLFGYLYKSICFIHIYDYNNKFSIKFIMKKSLFYNIESWFDYKKRELKVIFNQLKYCTN